MSSVGSPQSAPADHGEQRNTVTHRFVDDLRYSIQRQFERIHLCMALPSLWSSWTRWSILTIRSRH